MFPFAAKIIQKYNVKKSNLLAMAMLVMGAILRMGILMGIPLVYAGQMVIGGGITLLMSMQI